MTTTLPLLHDAAHHVLTQAQAAAPSVAQTVAHLSPCTHLPAWHTRPIRLSPDIREHQLHSRTFHDALTSTRCTCLHGLPEQLLAAVAKRWADALDAGAWYGQSAHRSSREVRDHSRRQYDSAIRDLQALTDWITSGSAAHTARGTW
ncbi:hypothetical protein [Streptomyces sp. NBC_01244]|uniref:hypothetical protein n=1 Tax=Streptomyces sp. NBC_01244 TaxID=2903797 RepID=UPI002E11EC01|nr:hypothetical protein OG247_44135 [Streptomyces sp. NBC_01244]